uniref:Tetraspanin n=1 Tax=Salmo trutta TaxID=8032 RepID=A0A674CSM1_SALTR
MSMIDNNSTTTLSIENDQIIGLSKMLTCMYGFRRLNQAVHDITAQSAMSRLHHLYGLLRYLMMLLSGIIFVSGLVLFGLGVWIRYGAATFVQVMGSFSAQLVTISYVCMCLGAILSLLGFIGCYGAWSENRCLIMLYFFIVSMMFAAEVTGVIFILVYKDLVEVMIRGASKDSLRMSYMGPTAADPISTAWNTIMVHYKCCGFDNSTADFTNSVFSANTGLLYPKTCCVDLTSTACDGLDTTLGLIHPKSCITKLINVIQDQSVIFGSTASGICVMELASMMVSVVLFVRLGNTYY